SNVASASSLPCRLPPVSPRALGRCASIWRRCRTKHLCYFQCGNGSDLLSKLLLGPLQIVSLLQIEPEVRAISAQLPEPQCHHRRHRLLFPKNVIERLARHPE